MSLVIIALAIAVQPAEQAPYCAVQGDKLVPTGHASATKLDWFKGATPVDFSKSNYIKYGMPQIMGPDDLQFWQMKDDVPVMIKTGGTKDIVYVQSSSTLCEFQPYRILEEPKAEPKKKRRNASGETFASSA